MIKKEHFLSSAKVDSDKNIMVISEMHFSDTRSLGQINKIVDMAAKERATHIVIPGDLYNGEDKTIYHNTSHLRGFLNCISQIAPVYYVQGNSEQQSSYLPGFMYEPRFFLSPFVSFLGKFHIGIKPDDIAAKDDVSVVGLGLPREIHEMRDACKPYAIASYCGKWFSELENILATDKFNILVCHDPMVGEALSYFELRPDLFDLIVTGRKHGGDYPDWLKTLLTLSSEFMAEAYPKYQGGFYDIEGIDAKMFVGSGVTEYVLDNKEQEIDHEGIVDFIRIRKI